MYTSTLLIAAASAAAVQAAFIDEITPACVSECEKVGPLIDSCMANASAALYPCSMKACENDWDLDFRRCFNCENIQDPALNYTTYAERDMWVDNMKNCHPAGYVYPVKWLSWEELNNTVGGKTVAATATWASLTIPIGPTSSASTTADDSNDAPGDGGKKKVKTGEIVGAAFAGATAIGLGLGFFVGYRVVRRRQRRKVSRGDTESFDIDPPNPPPHPFISPFKSKRARGHALARDHSRTSDQTIQPSPVEKDSNSDADADADVVHSISEASPSDTDSIMPSPSDTNPLATPQDVHAPTHVPAPVQVAPQTPRYKQEVLRRLDALPPSLPGIVPLPPLPLPGSAIQAEDAGRIAHSPRAREEVPPRYDPRWEEEG